MEQSMQQQLEAVTRQAAAAVSRVLEREEADAKTVREMVAALKDLSTMVGSQTQDGIRIVLEREIDGFSA